MNGAEFDTVAIADPQDKPLDQVGQCADIFCQRPIHFGDRCIQRGNELYCNEHCYIGSTARIVEAGTETLTI